MFVPPPFVRGAGQGEVTPTNFENCLMPLIECLKADEMCLTFHMANKLEEIDSNKK